MPNVNAPRGLIPVCYTSGAPYNGAHNVYFVPASYATALFIGDPVIIITNSADANGIPVVNRAAGTTGTGITGVVVGGAIPAGQPTIGLTRDSPVYRPASVAQYIAVADDPTLLFEAQEDSVGGALVAGAGGRNIELIAGAGSTVTGYSGFQLDSSQLATTAAHPIRVLRAVQRSDNAIGANAKWLVKINAGQHTQLQALGI